MTSAQTTAFNQSTGGIAPADLLLVIASVLALIYLLWLAWMAYAQFRLWQSGLGTFYDVIFITSRAAVIALLVGFYIR